MHIDEPRSGNEIEVRGPFRGASEGLELYNRTSVWDGSLVDS